MSENAPLTPPGGVPPKPVEAAKVQPKKETVRISLPPKPTAAPTIKIPSPAAPTAATAAAAAPLASAAPSAPAAAPAPPRAAAPAAPAPAAPSRPAPMPRPSAGASVSGLDKGLAIATAIVGVLVVVRLFLI